MSYQEPDEKDKAQKKKGRRQSLEEMRTGLPDEPFPDSRGLREPGPEAPMSASEADGSYAQAHDTSEYSGDWTGPAGGGIPFGAERPMTRPAGRWPGHGVARAEGELSSDEDKPARVEAEIRSDLRLMHPDSVRSAFSGPDEQPSTGDLQPLASVSVGGLRPHEGGEGEYMPEHMRGQVEQLKTKYHRVYNPVTGTVGSTDVPSVRDKEYPQGVEKPPHYSSEQYQPVTERDFNPNRSVEELPPVRARRWSHPGYNVPLEGSGATSPRQPPLAASAAARPAALEDQPTRTAAGKAEPPLLTPSDKARDTERERERQRKRVDEKRGA